MKTVYTELILLQYF